MRPLYGSTEPASIIGNVNDLEPMVEDFALSPDTFNLLQAYLNSDTSAQAELMKCAEEMRRVATIKQP
jgi:hypothetical protein